MGTSGLFRFAFGRPTLTTTFMRYFSPCREQFRQQFKTTEWPCVGFDFNGMIKPIMTECTKAGASLYARRVSAATTSRPRLACFLVREYLANTTGQVPASCLPSVRDPYTDVRPFVFGLSPYADQELMSEMQVCMVYRTEVLMEGNGSMRFLEDLATQPNDHDGSGDVCCEVPREAFDGKDYPDAKFGPLCLQSFFRLVANVKIDAVVKVSYNSIGGQPTVSHLVVLGPAGFQMCTCLQVMRRGLQCRHVFAALVLRLNRGSEFTGASIHPRWRPKNAEPWSLERVVLGRFDGGGGAEGGGEFGDPVGEIGPEPALLSVQKPVRSGVVETSRGLQKLRLNPSSRNGLTRVRSFDEQGGGGKRAKTRNPPSMV